MAVGFLPLQGLLRLYVEVWRGLPIIVTIFLVYYALPDAPVIHHRFAAFTGAAVGLTLWGSAQIAEATRGAVQSIPREQHEAAAALGFGWVGRHRSVILPQALRRLLPPLVSLQANVIQNTTIAYLSDVLLSNLDELQQDLRDLWQTLTRDPAKEARKERAWTVLSGVFTAVAAIVARRMAAKAWGVLTGEAAPMAR